MKNIRSFSEFINEGFSDNPEIENYMVFGNLQNIKKNAEFLLAMDPIKMDEILQNGHDWAEDHISVANENLDQVMHFFKNLPR